jgi:Carboxypeptidase regulatory-like domain/TonB-dependent Receptor Plug Domain
MTLRAFRGTLFFLLFTASSALAQNSGTIVGNVHDSSGAQIEGATITVTNVEKGTSQTAVSGSDGEYVVPFLPTGTYRVSVEKPGFQRQDSPPTQVDVDQHARLDFSLAVGNVSQTVEVTSQASLIRSESAELGEVITQKPIENLPLNGRNFAQLVYLVPGVTAGQQGENLGGNSTFNPRAGSNFNALGAQEGSSGWLVDGIIDNEYTFNTVMVQPSVESIQEFKVLTGIYSAEYGRGSGIVTTQTRSGTNAFHGDAFEFHRNAVADARSYFNTLNQQKPAYIRNQFGASLGGPIWKNKTFFFMDYYGQTQIQGSTFVNTVPTALDRTGDFSDQNFTIYNPFSTTVNAAGQTVRTPFPNNTIPAGLINPIGSTIVNLYPLPNVPGTINNYVDSLDSTIVDNGGNVRIDHQFSTKDSLFGRYSYERYTAFAAKGQGGCCIKTPPGLQQKYDLGPYISGGQNTTLLASGLALNETHIFSPTIVNQVIAGYSHDNPLTLPSDYGLNGATALGIEGINISETTSGIPTFTIGGAGGGTSYTAINDGPAILPTNVRETVYQFQDGVSWTKNAHSFTFGYRLVRYVVSAFSQVNPRGSLNFQQNLTNNPVTSSGGSGLASLLMGLMANNVSAGATRSFMLNRPVLEPFEHALYFQDNWKFNRRLTLNLGARWDLFNPYTEKDNHLTNFDYSALTLIYAGVNGVSRTANVRTRYNDIAPRIGFSYDLSGKGDLVLRGGYAISYTPEQPSVSPMLVENLPWNVVLNTVTLPLYPNEQSLALDPPLSNPFPAPIATQPTTTAQLIAANPTVESMGFPNQTPTFTTYSLNIEKQFMNSYLLEIAYAGSRSNHLLFCENPQEVQPGPTSEPVVDRITIPAIANVRSMNYCANTNSANYNGLNTKLTKRLTTSLSALVSYSWSKSLDYGGSAANGGGAVGSPQTITNLRAGYGPSGYNIPHRFVSSWVWNLPAGQGRKWLNSGGPASYVLGGWEFDGISTIQSGYPFTVTSLSACPNNASFCWPDLVGSTKPIHQTYANWYNPAAFAVPCQGALNANNGCATPAYRYGNEGRGILRGPQTVNFDLSAAKNFPIKERVTLQFRVDAFDALNHPPMGFPNQTLNVTSPATSSTAITSTYADNRDLQGSLKLTF